MTDIVAEPDERCPSEELSGRVHFLTARYRLYTMIGKRLGYAQIEHAPWPLARVKVRELRQTLIEAAGLPSPEGEPQAHYSAELEVKIGFPRIAP